MTAGKRAEINREDQSVSESSSEGYQALPKITITSLKTSEERSKRNSIKIEIDNLVESHES